MNEIIYVPKTPVKRLAEFEIAEIMQYVDGRPGVPKICMFEVNGTFGSKVEYKVNLGSGRYHLFKNSLECACCGIKGTYCSLDVDAQNSTKENSIFHFNFYAESGSNDSKLYRILMEKDHIAPVSSGGEDSDSSLENYQTMCFNCNRVKSTLNISNDDLRRIMFPAYRSYKSAISLNKAKELTKPIREHIKKQQNAIQAITNALDIVTDETRKEGMKNRIPFIKEEIKFLMNKCDLFETNAQITGKIDSLEAFGLKEIKNENK